MRKTLKKLFDKIAYRSALLNKILRNANKLFSGVTSFRLRPYGVLNVRYCQAKFKMATNETSYVTKQIFWNGAGNFEYTPIFEKLIRHCSSFIDIGANSGYYSMLAATVNPSIIVHAFEPASGPFQFLKRNIELNGLQARVFAHPIALSNSKGNVEFFEITNPLDTVAKHNLSGVGALKKMHETQKQSVVKMVRAETLDGYAKHLALAAFDLIKIDTEGTENLVLEGLHDIITRHSPIIICETLFNKIEGKLEEIMTQHGYLFFNHLNGKLHPTRSLIRHVDNGVSDCFFVKANKTILIQDFIQR